MHWYQLATEGFGLGLSLGATCLTTCAPIYLPYLLAEQRKTLSSFLIVLEISAGRFFAYLAFGAVVGMLGGQIEAMNRELFTSIADLLVAVFMVVTALRTHREHKGCAIPKLTRFTQNAFLLGILTGVNFCPGFLGSLSRAMAAGGAFGGMTLFFGFFLGTSLFVLPMGFAGVLTQVKKLIVVGRIASLVAAAWFVFVGVKGIVNVERARHIDNDSRRVEILTPGKHLTIVTSDSLAFRELRDSLAAAVGQPVSILSPNAIRSLTPQDSSAVFIDSRLVKDHSTALQPFDYITVEPGYPVSGIMSFLRLHVFLSDAPFRWAFTLEAKGSRL